MSTPERCRAIRTSLGLSARAMSTRVGLGNSMWTHYELGKREPGMESFRRLYNLGVSLDWFISGEGDMWREGVALPPDPAPSHVPDMEQLLGQFETLLDSYHVSRLQVWSRIVDELEKSATGLTFEALLSKLPLPIEASLLKAELTQLEAKGLYRLRVALFA